MHISERYGDKSRFYSTGIYTYHIRICSGSASHYLTLKRNVFFFANFYKSVCNIFIKGRRYTYHRTFTELSAFFIFKSRRKAKAHIYNNCFVRLHFEYSRPCSSCANFLLNCQSTGNFSFMPSFAKKLQSGNYRRSTGAIIESGSSNAS